MTTGATMHTEGLRDLHCQECGDHDIDCKGIVLSPRCHPGRGTVVGCHGQHVDVTCTCGQLVAVFHAPSAFDAKGVQLRAACHNKGVFVVYKKATHAFDFQCAGCKKVVGTLAIPAAN